MKIARRHTWMLIVGLLLFGYFSRLIHLGDQSIWGDEAFTYVVIRSDNFWNTLARDVHPPLYFMMITLWTRFAGISEFGLRFPSVLASTISLALMYVLAKESLRHRPVNLIWGFPFIAVLLMSLADLDIQISQEARSYTLHIVWIVLSFIAYLKWLRTGKKLWAGVFIISNALIVYTHYIGVFTPFALGLHALLFLRGRQRIYAIGMLILSAVLVVPWVLIVLSQQVEKFAGDAVPALSSSWETLWSLRTSWFTQQWAFMLGLALLGFFPTNRKSLRLIGFLLIVILFPLILAFISNRWLPVLFDYRISQITPAIMLLIAYGLANFRREVVLFFLAVIVGYGVFSVDVYRPKEPWREFGQMVSEYAKREDAVLLDFTGGDYTMDYYLERYLNPEIPVVSMWQWRTFEAETYEGGVLGYLDSYDSIWLARWSSNEESFTKLRVTNHVPTMRRTITHFGNEFELYRFDRLADDTLVTFENGMILQHAEVQGGEIELWWTSENPMDENYTVSVKLLDSHQQVIAQTDRQPQLDLRLTSTWQPDEIIYDPYHFDNQGEEILIQVYLWTPEGIQLVNTISGESGTFLPKTN